MHVAVLAIDFCQWIHFKSCVVYHDKNHASDQPLPANRGNFSPLHAIINLNNQCFGLFMSVLQHI